MTDPSTNGLLLRYFRVFPTMLRVGFSELVAYRGEVLIWVLTTTMPLIMFEVWSTIAMEAPIGRFDHATFGGYFLSTLVVRQLASAWVVFELNYVIRTGQLAVLLLRPVHPLAYFAATNLGALPFRLIVLGPVVIGAFVLLPDMPIVFTPLHLGLYVLTTMMAWLLTFLIQSVVGMLALYTQQSLALQEAWFGAWAILSGYLIPLEIAPGLQAVAVWLPFRSMGSLPTEIVLGHLTGASLVQGIGAQVGWVLIVLVLVISFWRRAIRRFEAHGG